MWLQWCIILVIGIMTVVGAGAEDAAMAIYRNNK